MREKIKDEYTNLEASRQRKWALRNKDKVKAIQKAYEASDKAKERRKRYYLNSKRLRA